MTVLASARAWARRHLAPTPADGPPRWVSGLLAGVQAGVLSVLVVALPALVGYVVTSADPANDEVGWLQAVGVAVGVWLLGHGGALRADGVLVTFVPLGIALLAVATTSVSVRRSAHPTRTAWAAATAGYTGVAVVAVVATGRAGPAGAGAVGVLGSLLGAAALAGVGAGLGTRRLRPAAADALARAPLPLRVGIGGAAVATATLLAAGVVVTLWWLLAGRAAAADVVVGLGLDAVGGGVLALAQLLVLPNLVVWAVAWLAGPGFSVGSGTLWSPTEVVSAPMPALPVLGVLPPEAGYGWAPVAVVGAGLVAGWYVHRGLRHAVVAARWWHVLAACATVALVSGLAVAVLQVTAGGAVGPGRMVDVGAGGLAVGGAVAALVALGALLLAVPADRAVRAAVVGLVRDGVRRRGTSAKDGATGDAGSATATAAEDPARPRATDDGGDQPSGGSSSARAGVSASGSSPAP